MMARKGDIKELNEPDAMFFVLMYKDTFLSTNALPSTLPSTILNVLQEYEDVSPDEVPPGLPTKRGIEHQIDLVPGASLPNKAAYRTNPEETKKIQRGKRLYTWPRLDATKRRGERHRNREDFDSISERPQNHNRS
jgi:hypothetical protein